MGGKAGTGIGSKVKKEIFARVLVNTQDATRATIEAGYKATPKNVVKGRAKLAKDPYVQKRIKELLEEKYPVAKRAEDVTELFARAVSMAKESNKLNEVLAAIQVLAKFAGANPDPGTTKVLHGHIVQPATLPGPEVIPALKLPKE